MLFEIQHSNVVRGLKQDNDLPPNPRHGRSHCQPMQTTSTHSKLNQHFISLTKHTSYGVNIQPTLDPPTSEGGNARLSIANECKSSQIITSKR